MSRLHTYAVCFAVSLSAVAELAAANPQAMAPAAPRQLTQADALSLVRSTLMSVHDANFSGNYTVLKDLGSPAFQRRSANELSALFAPLRDRNLDLFAAASAPSSWSQPPAIEAGNRLHLRGSFATRPHAVVFDFTFEPIDGVWKHAKLTIGLKPVASQ